MAKEKIAKQYTVLKAQKELLRLLQWIETSGFYDMHVGEIFDAREWKEVMETLSWFIGIDAKKNVAVREKRLKKFLTASDKFHSQEKEEK